MLGRLEVPSIMECCHFQCITEPHDKYMIRCVMDYELDFNLIGGRVTYLDGVAYHVPPNSLVCRHPGQHVSGEGVYDMYMLTLDYTNQLPPMKVPRHVEHATQPLVDSYFWQMLPPCFEPKHAQEILSLYRKLYLHSEPGLLAELFHLIAADVLSLQNDTLRKPTAVEQTLNYLNEHYARRITLDELAENVHQSKSYLVRCFHQETGLTPIACLNNIRLSRAQTMLRYMDESVSSIAFQCGFEDASYFSLCFRQRFGLSPSAYRNQKGPTPSALLK